MYNHTFRQSSLAAKAGAVTLFHHCLSSDTESVNFLSPKVCGWRLLAEAIRTTVVPISGVIRTTVVPISGVIGPTVVRIANATGIGYRHDGSIRFSNKLTHALNY